MNASDLSRVGPGFDQEAMGSQAVFRSALSALSYPGRWTAVEAAAATPQATQRAAALLLLALVDAETPVWLSPRLQGDAAAWLRFHTGCPLVDEPGQALYAWVAAGDPCPPLAQLAQGTEQDPDRSATLVVEVAEAQAGPSPHEHAVERWQLSGPGIAATHALEVAGAPPGFAAQWQHNHQGFPRGVDVFLAQAHRVAGLPRTTRIASMPKD